MRTEVQSALALLFAGLSLGAGAAFAAVDSVPFAPGERVVCLGDSITDGGYYTSYLQLFTALRHPGSKTVFHNAGIGGETAAGGLKRFDWDVAERKPDRVAVMFGMNDLGGKTPAEDAAREASYATNMCELARRIRGIGAKGTFILPSPYDEWGDLPGNPPKAGRNGCLRRGADIVARIAAENGFATIDFHHPLTDVCRRHPGKFQRDRIHPDKVGHLLMAVCAFEESGESPFVSRVELGAGDLPYRYAPTSLPMPVGAEYLEAEKLMPVTDRINREILVVRGLPRRRWTLEADGRALGTFTAAELEAGVNLALLDTPNQRLAKEMDAVSLKLGKDMSTLRLFARFRGNLAPYGGDIENRESAFAALEKWYADRKAETNGKLGIDQYFYDTFKELYPTLGQLRKDIDAARETLRAVRPVAWTISLREAGRLTVGLVDVCATNGTANVPLVYVRALERAGHAPIVLPRLGDASLVARQVEKVDIVLFCGGEDVDPARYGMEKSPRCEVVNEARDAFEWRVLDACARMRRPVFGICRGCQLLNCYFGGTLYQDINTEVAGVGRHRYRPGAARGYVDHEVALVPGSRLQSVLAKDRISAKTRHHQSVRKLAPGFRVSARTDDGVVEAIESDEYPAAGVQFHPEQNVKDDPSGTLLEIFRRLDDLCAPAR